MGFWMRLRRTGSEGQSRHQQRAECDPPRIETEHTSDRHMLSQCLAQARDPILRSRDL